ncbi:hypothetical protein [[Eubacterium] cellulosolvens]
MGKVEKGVKCIIKGCTEHAVRSISYEKVILAKMNTEPSRRGYLCERHYKDVKKRTKQDRKLEKWRFMS